MEKSSNKRQSNIELLRIFAILIIIMNHYVGYGHFASSGINSIILEWFHLGGKLGVDIFIIISAYFLYESEHCKLEKVLRIVFQVLFYSIIIIIVGVHFNLFDTMDIIHLLFAIPFGNWRFITLYVVMYVLHPWINVLLHNLNDKQLIKLWLLMLVFWCVIPTFTGAGSGIEYDITWYTFLYITAVVVKRCEHRFNKTAIVYITLALLTMIIAFSLMALFSGKVPFFSKFHRIYGYIRNYYSVFYLVTSVCLFLGFKKLNIGSVKIINTLAGTTLGVFLIHDSNLRKEFWNSFLHVGDMGDSPFMILHIIGVAIGIYLVGSVIDLLRKYLLEIPIFNALHDHILGIENRLNSFSDTITEKLTVDKK